jgi:hypothetical protein
MSKLADQIRRAVRVEGLPLGFVSGKAKPPPSMLLVAFLPERWGRSAAESVEAGADALLLTGKPSERDMAEAIEAAGERPCGVLLPDADAPQLERIHSSGIDFAILDPQAHASALLDEQLGLVLQIRDELTDMQLRVLDALSLDALYVERESGPLTIFRQMELQRIGGLSRKALLVRARADAQQQDLLALREAGVALLGIDLRERDGIEGVRHLRAVIDGLPRRRARKRSEERSEVRLPGVSSTAAPAGDEEDEEDESE